MTAFGRRVPPALLLLAGMVTFCAPAANAADGPAAAPPAPAGAKKGRTYHDCVSEQIAYERRTLVDAYDAVGTKDAKWDDAAKAVLAAAAGRQAVAGINAFYHPADTPTAAGAVALGKAAVDGAGCTDPMVRFQYAAALDDAGRPDLAYPLMGKAVPDLAKSKYADRQVARALLTLAALSPDVDERSRLRAEGRRRLTDACCEKPEVADRRALMVDAWDHLMTTSRDVQRAFVDGLARRPDADPWIVKNLRGRLFILLAWDSRGSGFANTVTEEGWEGFHKNIRLARDQLKPAWRLRPDLPQTCAEMLTVSMADGEGLNESALDWFGKANEAQYDYLGAYNTMATTLLPRWNGSYRQMLDMAEACAAQQRYDTLVPWQYVEMVGRIGKDSAGRDAGKDPWALLRDEKIYGRVVEVADAYAKALEPRRGAYFKTAHAAAAWRADNLPEARRVLEEMAKAGLKPDPAALEYFGAADGGAVPAEVFAKTGPEAAALRRADVLADDGRKAEAVAALKAAAAKLPAADPGTAHFALRAAMLDADVKFAAGEWAPAQFGKSLARWRVMDGTWAATADGGLEGHGPEPGKPKTLIWRGREFGQDLGRSFEVAFVVRQLPQAKVGQFTTAGVALISPETRRRGVVYVCFSHKGAGFFAVNDKDTGFEADVKDGCEVMVRCTGDKVAIFVNGKEAGDPAPLADRFNGRLDVGLSGFDGSPIRFENVRVRKLPEEKKE